MDLLCKKDEQFSRITTIQPDSVFSVPLILAHKAALYLRPAGFGFVQGVFCSNKIALVSLGLLKIFGSQSFQNVLRVWEK